jgi:hypothetical protein
MFSKPAKLDVGHHVLASHQILRHNNFELETGISIKYPTLSTMTTHFLGAVIIPPIVMDDYSKINHTIPATIIYFSVGKLKLKIIYPTHKQILFKHNSITS